MSIDESHLPPRGIRFFVTRVEQPRSRRATDLLVLLVAGALLAGYLTWTVPPLRFERWLLRGLDVFPRTIDRVWFVLVCVVVLAALAMLVAGFVRSRFRVLRDLAVGAALGGIGAALVTNAVADSWAPLWDLLRTDGLPARPAAIVFTVAAALALSAIPHVIRPVRTTLRWTVVISAIALVLYDAATPGLAFACLATAVVASAIVHLAFGSSMGRPDLGDVTEALIELGVDAQSVGVADRQPAGVFVVDAVDADGNRLIAKVYGRDAHDTQLLNTLWRTFLYREAGAPTFPGRRQQAEHEAFVTLLADQSDVLTQRVITAGATPANDVLLVLRDVGQQLDEAPEQWSVETATRAWKALGRLHEAGIAHSQVDDRHLVVEGDEVGLVDFRGAVVAPSRNAVLTDQAQLLVTTALGIGMDAAITTARAALGRERLGATLPFVQTSALTMPQRRSVRQADLDLDDLRALGAEQAKVELPGLRKLRRVTVRSLIELALLGGAFFALAAGAGRLDVEQLGEQLAHANWWLIALAVLIAQTPRFSQTASALGAAPIKIPVKPVYMLQLATSYIALAVPSSAGRIAMNIRFFQKRGLRPGTAMAIGVLDSVTQFVMQISLLIGILVLTPASLDVDVDTAALDTLLVIVLVIAAAVVAIGIALAVSSKLRDRLRTAVSALAADALDAVRGLGSRRRLSLLLGGNLMTELLWALTLMTFVAAFGYSIGFTELIVIIVSVQLIAMILPIPGGIGVVEAGIIVGLVRADIPEGAAFAAVLLYRMATFYLPPIWGFFAQRWLERNKHL